MIRHESVITALIGAVLGIILGIILGGLLAARLDFVGFSIPVGKRQSVKVNYSTGASVRAGQNFDTFAAAWQILWF